MAADTHEVLIFETLGAGAGTAVASGKKFPGSLGPFELSPSQQVLPEDLKVEGKPPQHWTLQLADLTTKSKNSRQSDRSRETFIKSYKNILEKGVRGQFSDIAALSLPEHERKELDIPPEATTFAWSYPMDNSKFDAVKVDELASLGEPSLCFLFRGGYVYFDKDGRAIQILALVPNGAGALAFAAPRKLSAAAVADRLKADGFFPITKSDLSSATKYCWIQPGEKIDGKEVSHGGFAYLFPQGVGAVQPRAPDTPIRGGEKALASSENMRQYVVCTFKKFDTSGDGIIQRDELTKILTHIGGKWDTQAVDQIVQVADKNKDGRIQYEEFIEWLFSVAKGQALHDQPVEFQAGEIIAKLPNKTKLCILGGRGFKDPHSEMLVQEIAKRCATNATIKDTIVILTGGLQGVQQTFATSLGPNTESVHMLPEVDHRLGSGFGVGRDQVCGVNMEQRMAIFGIIGDIYLTIEGGPGVAKEACAAHKNNAVVLPMMWTGGASGGLFDFPPSCLQKPDFATAEEWSAIKEKGTAAPEVFVGATADCVVSLIVKLVKKGVRRK